MSEPSIAATNTDDGSAWRELRKPFPKELVGKLPRVTCRNCSQGRGSCDRHEKQKCPVCGAWISTAHIHLDYVGHAAVTDRLLAVDPHWSWEPMTFDGSGLPAFDQYGGLWIRLSVAGVERIGYGDSQGKTGPNAVKEAIGDALRNAAMRFGVGLDLWAKEDLQADDRANGLHTNGTGNGRAARPQPPDNAAQAEPASDTPAEPHPKLAKARAAFDAAGAAESIDKLRAIHDEARKQRLLRVVVVHGDDELPLSEWLDRRRTQLAGQLVESELGGVPA